MTRGPFAVDVEALLAEGAWVRALAKRLVGGRGAADDADDVVQDTWLAALEHAPEDAEHRRSWLARVTTNFARLKRRGDAHRAEREQRAARPELQPSASETAERLEAQRALVDALRALDEPYRTTVMRRYFDGQSAAEIARLDGIPAATVRWRLMRGVEELRAALDRRYGKRDAWCVAFLPPVRPMHLATATTGTTGTTAATATSTTAATGGTVLTGVLVMNALSRTVILSALVLSASLGVWLVTRESAPLSPPERAHAIAHADLDAPKSDAKAANEELSATTPADARAAVAALAEKPSSPAVAASLTAHVEGRFVDAGSRPIAHVRVTSPLGPDKQPVESDAQGRFDVEIPLSPPAGSMDFEAQCAGWATFFGRCSPRPGATDPMGDIVLEPGGAIAGSVVGPDGGPLANARVLATAPDIRDAVDNARRLGPERDHGVPGAVSANDGSFRIEGVPAKLVRAWANAEGMRWAISEPIEVPARGVHAGLVLKLEPLAAEDRIEGLVLDPDGHPMPDAHVSLSYRAADQSGMSGTTADASGHFRIVVIRKAPHDLEAGDPKQRWPSATLAGVQPGTLDANLRFREPRTIELVARDARGEPVPSVAVELRGPHPNSRMYWYDTEKPRDGGRVSIAVPDGKFTIAAWARGRTRAELGPFEPDAVPARLECTLEALPGVRGRVLAHGEPVSGAKVTLHEMTEDDMRIEHQGWLTRVNPHPEESETTDAGGSFEFTVRKKGSYAIQCQVNGFALAEIVGLEVDPKVGVDNLELRVGAGGAIEGRVLVPPGHDAAGVVVGVNAFDSFARTVRTGADGSFRFEHVTPGAWQVRRALSEIDLDPRSSRTSFGGRAKPVEYETDCVVEEGRATHFDLDLRKTFEPVIVGHVSVNGKPASGWTVMAWIEEGSGTFSTVDNSSAAVDARGDVRIVMPKPGRVALELRPFSLDASVVGIGQWMDLRPGDNPWVVDLQCGTIEGRVASSLDSRMLVYRWLDGGDLECSGNVAVDPQGHFRIAFVPAGKARLRLSAGLLAHEDEHPEDREITVKKGETTSVELP